MNFRLRLTLLVGVALAGCHGSQQPPQNQPPVTQTTPPAPTENPPPATPETPPAETTSAKPTLSFDSVPADLKNDAFHYYGLSDAKPKNYKIDFSNNPTSHQVVTVTATKIDSDKVEFDEEDVGSPSATESMSLTADGIYVESLKPQVLQTPHFLDLPAKLSPGAKWENHQSVLAGAAVLKEDLSYKVVDEREVKTPAGTFKALYVVGTGSGSLNSKPTDMKVENWFVKDLGLVKENIQIRGKGANFTVQQILIK